MRTSIILRNNRIVDSLNSSSTPVNIIVSVLVYLSSPSLWSSVEGFQSQSTHLSLNTFSLRNNTRILRAIKFKRSPSALIFSRIIGPNWGCEEFCNSGSRIRVDWIVKIFLIYLSDILGAILRHFMRASILLWKYNLFIMVPSIHE